MMTKPAIILFCSCAMLMSTGCGKRAGSASQDSAESMAHEEEVRSLEARIHEIEKSLSEIPAGSSIESMISETKAEIDETSVRIDALRGNLKQLDEQLQDER
jgi:peptidoglycan hydrolase CwlO-like protein